MTAELKNLAARLAALLAADGITGIQVTATSTAIVTTPTENAADVLADDEALDAHARYLGLKLAKVHGTGRIFWKA